MDVKQLRSFNMKSCGFYAFKSECAKVGRDQSQRKQTIRYGPMTGFQVEKVDTRSFKSRDTYQVKKGDSHLI